jgi:hypothetical protein
LSGDSQIHVGHVENFAWVRRRSELGGRRRIVERSLDEQHGAIEKLSRRDGLENDGEWRVKRERELNDSLSTRRDGWRRRAGKGTKKSLGCNGASKSIHSSRLSLLRLSSSVAWLLTVELTELFVLLCDLGLSVDNTQARLLGRGRSIIAESSASIMRKGVVHGIGVPITPVPKSY